MTSRVAVVTGGNGSLGYETCLQLAKAPTFSGKIILTARSAEKAQATIKQLVAASGMAAAAFDFVILDLLDHASCRAAVESLPASIDMLLLNAGVIDESLALTQHGVTSMFGGNTLGHAVLTEGLLAAGKLSAGARVILAGTEGTRNAWGFKPLQPGMSLALNEIASFPANPKLPCCACCTIRKKFGLYGVSKLIGTLWISKLADEHPGVYFASVSPGANVGSGQLSALPWPVGCLTSNCGCMMKCTNMAHSIDVGVARWIDAMLGDDYKANFPSGTVVGSPSTCLCWSGGEVSCCPYLGAAGPPMDQSKICCAPSYYTDKAMQAESARVIRDLIAADIPALAAEMER